MPSLSDRQLLFLLLALNALLKLSWLGVNELSGDEPFTVFWALQRRLHDKVTWVHPDFRDAIPDRLQLP